MLKFKDFITIQEGAEQLDESIGDIYRRIANHPEIKEMEKAGKLPAGYRASLGDAFNDMSSFVTKHLELAQKDHATNVKIGEILKEYSEGMHNVWEHVARPLSARLGIDYETGKALDNSREHFMKYAQQIVDAKQYSPNHLHAAQVENRAMDEIWRTHSPKLKDISRQELRMKIKLADDHGALYDRLMGK